jgi:ketosteroid isomerase-like protein
VNAASTPGLTTDHVLAAADHLVAAFAATDTDAYFACFAESATFVFHPEARRLGDRAAYEALWADWLASGWRVEECESGDRLVQVLGDSAVFSHSVRTVTSVAGERSTTLERESIVFTLVDGDLLAVHEHLSPAPQSKES